MILVIGVGNEFRSDDRVGLLALRELSPSPELNLRECSGEGTALMSLWEGHSQVLLLDATQGHGTPGTITTWNASRSTEKPSYEIRCSSHSFGVREAIELARSLGQLPRELIVIGLEGQSFTQSTELSPSVHEHFSEYVQRIQTEIRRMKTHA